MKIGKELFNKELVVENRRYNLIERAARLGVRVVWAQNTDDGDETDAVHLLNPTNEDLEDALNNIEFYISEAPTFIYLHADKQTFPVRA